MSDVAQLRGATAYKQLVAWSKDFHPSIWGYKAPERFAEKVLGIRPFAWQRKFLRAFGRGDAQISVAACHGPGKTCMSACLVWFQAICRFPQNTVITAPSKPQLEDALWGEVKSLARWDPVKKTGLPPEIAKLYKVTTDRIELIGAESDSWVSARTARAENPVALQGVHCANGWTLIIADEASGVSDKVFNAAKGSMSGERVCTILLGNPNYASGYFYETHEGMAAPDWTKFQIGYDDCEDCRHLVTEEFKNKVARESGRESNEYRIRVLGKFPVSGASVIIPRGWVDDAVKRDIDEGAAPLPSVWGLDVAGGGKHASGHNALVKRTELGVSADMLYWPGDDPMLVAGKVRREFENTPVAERPRTIMIDVIGIGMGVYSRLRELGLPVRAVNVAETKGINANRYQNLKIFLWWRAREWFGRKACVMPECDGSCVIMQRDRCIHQLLRSELSAVQYEASPMGRMKCEEKRIVVERTGLKLDLADAFILTFTEDIGILHGTGRTSRWPDKYDTVNYGSVG